MALSNEVLNSFFNLRPKKNHRSSLSIKSDGVSCEEAPIPKQKYKTYKLFDNPIEIKDRISRLNANTEIELSLEQTQDESRTNIGQTQDESRTNIGQIQDEYKTELRTKPRTILERAQNKAKQKTDFSSLVGLQRNIAYFLYEICKTSRDKLTPALSIEHIALSCGTTKLAAQKSIQRLENKLILKRREFKSGRGGWTKYELLKDVYQEILHNETNNKYRTNIGQIQDKYKTELRTKFRTASSSSSGIYINKTTTGGLENLLSSNLEQEWSEINIEPLSKINFTKTHIVQIASQNLLSAEMVQSSIYAFAFDLTTNDKAKTIAGDPLNYFMGILRKGMPYTPPANYESPRDQALRLYRERMRIIEQNRLAAEKEAIDLAFNHWFSQLTEEQKRALLPELFRNTKNLENNKILKSTARRHFEEEIWPERLTEILGNNSPEASEIQSDPSSEEKNQDQTTNYHQEHYATALAR